MPSLRTTQIHLNRVRLVSGEGNRAVDGKFCGTETLVYASKMAAISLGSYVFNPGVGLADANGKVVAINQRGLAILDVLLSAQGKTVSKSELMERVWPGQIVEEGNLTVQIATLRKVLGERQDGSEWIITVPRVGYRMLIGLPSSIPATTAKVTAPLPEQPTLAVLPFQNLSGDPGQDYFADGIVEDIITALSRFKSFAVVARNSSFTYKGRAVDVREVAKELGVRYVLEGTIRREGNKLRLAAQLVEGSTGLQLWAQKFDGPIDELFEFQDRITETVATILEPQIQAAELERSRRERPGSIDVYDLFLQARSRHFAVSAKDTAGVLTLLQQALTVEPDNAPVLGLAAFLLNQRNVHGWETLGPDDKEKCLEYARRGLLHAAGDAAVMAHCGNALLQYVKDYDWAMAVIQSAVEANPNYFLANFVAGVGNLHCGDVDEALRYFERAIRLSPRDPTAYLCITGIAHVHMIRADFHEALLWATKALTLNPDNPPTNWIMVAANAKLGRIVEAQRMLAEYRKLAPTATVSSIWAGQPQKHVDRCAAILDGLRLAGLPESPPEAPILPSLAVLPFQNLSSDPEQDYFADGIVEDIITALSRFKSFAVIARNSSFAYKDRAIDVRQAATELGVRYVVEGSVRRAGNTLRISAKLVDAARGAQLWAEKYEGTLEDVFAFQDRITESVIWLVEPKIQMAEIERSRRERPGSIAAYDLYLQTLHGFLIETADENAKSYDKLSQALALEPNNALFLSRAAVRLMARNINGYPPIGVDDIAKCTELARRGLEHAAGDGGAMACCGIALMQTAKEYDYGMEVLRSAVEINPNDFMVVAQMGVASLHCGDIADALTYFHRAIRLSPGDPLASLSLTGIAHAHMAQGNYEEALQWANRSRVLSVDFDPAYWMLIAANAQLGRMEEARRFLKEYQRHAPGVTIANIKAGQPAKDPSRMANILEGLRLAGME